MSDRPLVSVVIPTYNQPQLLLETLQSVFAQTLTDYEIVVVNDGSTDDTLERLRPVADRIRIISQENTGIGGARNRGIAESRGKYVALLDHDDLWMSEKLEEQAGYFEKHPECSIV
jgi:glycosyltransferase involved in cell wall biosynthesis